MKNNKIRNFFSKIVLSMFLVICIAPTSLIHAETNGANALPTQVKRVRILGGGGAPAFGVEGINFLTEENGLKLAEANLIINNKTISVDIEVNNMPAESGLAEENVEYFTVQYDFTDDTDFLSLFTNEQIQTHEEYLRRMQATEEIEEQLAIYEESKNFYHKFITYEFIFENRIGDQSKIETSDLMTLRDENLNMFINMPVNNDKKFVRAMSGYGTPGSDNFMASTVIFDTQEGKIKEFSVFLNGKKAYTQFPKYGFTKQYGENVSNNDLGFSLYHESYDDQDDGVGEGKVVDKYAKYMNEEQLEYFNSYISQLSNNNWNYTDEEVAKHVEMLNGMMSYEITFEMESGDYVLSIEKFEDFFEAMYEGVIVSYKEDTTKPVDPVEPVDPVDPIDPIDPVEPVEPVKPVKPTSPTESIEKIDTTTNSKTDSSENLPATGMDNAIVALGSILAIVGVVTILMTRKPKKQ